MTSYPPLKGARPGSPGALKRLESRFDIIWTEAKIGGITLLLPQFADTMAYIEERWKNGLSGGDALPYWTKLWPASLLLGHYAVSRLGQGSSTVLELGAGLSLPGLAAAAAGRQVLLTDLDPDALEFGMAGAEKNGLASRVSAQSLDWRAPGVDLGSFETVLGAEILYTPSLYPDLVKLMAGLLSGGGTAFISHEQRPFNINFFQMAKARFDIRRTQSVLGKNTDDPTTIYLYMMRLKK